MTSIIEKLQFFALPPSDFLAFKDVCTENLYNVICGFSVGLHTSLNAAIFLGMLFVAFTNIAFYGDMLADVASSLSVQ